MLYFSGPITEFLFQIHGHTEARAAQRVQTQIFCNFISVINNWHVFFNMMRQETHEICSLNPKLSLASFLKIKNSPKQFPQIQWGKRECYGSWHFASKLLSSQNMLRVSPASKWGNLCPRLGA